MSRIISAPVAPTSPSLSTATRGATIVPTRKALLADADCASAAQLVVALSGMGVQAGVCNDGSNLIEQAKKILPDIVLIDTDLPRTDIGSVIRVLARFPTTRSVVIILTTPPGTDTSKLARLQGLGAFRVICRSTAGPVLLEVLQAALDQSKKLQQRQADEDETKVCPTRHVLGNSSLLARRVFCPFHDNFVALERFVLRTGKVVAEQSLFDLPIYKHAAPKCDFVNFHLLAVSVCPQCFFATNEPSYFHDPSETRFKMHPHSQQTRDALIGQTPERLRLASKISRDFFTEKRTPADALISYELAIATSTVIHACNRYVLPIEQLRIANYHLRVVHLLELDHADNSAIEVCAEKAIACLKQGFTVLEGGPLSKTTYQLVTLSIAMGEDKSAYAYLARLIELAKEPAANSDDCAALERYLSQGKAAWEDRERHRFPSVAARLALDAA